MKCHQLADTIPQEEKDMTKKNAGIDWSRTINWDVVDKNAEVLSRMFERAEARQESVLEDPYAWLPKIDEQKLQKDIIKIIQK